MLCDTTSEFSSAAVAWARVSAWANPSENKQLEGLSSRIYFGSDQGLGIRFEKADHHPVFPF